MRKLKLHPFQLVGTVSVAVSLLFHFYAIWTIAEQPLDVNGHPEAQRSIVWPLYNDTIHRIGPGADFFALYNAAQALRRGGSLYRSSPEELTPYFYPFRYLPLVAQTLGLFVIQFSPIVAYRIWIVALEVVLGCLLIVFGRRTRGWLRYFGICALLLSSPYFLEVHMGQFTFVAASLLAIGLLLQEKGGWMSWKLRGAVNTIAYTCAVLFKVFPIVAAVAFMRRKAYWFPLAVAIVSGLAFSVPYFATHPNEFRAFYDANFVTPGGLDSGNYGLTYLVYLVVRDLRPTIALRNWDTALMVWRVSLLGLTALLVLFSRGDRVVVGSVAMILAHFVSYMHVWEHHMSGIVIMGLMMLQAISSERSPSRPLVCLIAACVIVLALPTPFALLDRLKDPRVWDPFTKLAWQVRYWVVLPKALPTGLLYLICVTILCRSGFTWPWKPSPQSAAQSAD
jgi:hypothetical protein